nr:MAG TPA: tail tape measure protein [Caudoviricetes sp.]
MASLKFDTTIETFKVISGFRDIQNAVHQTAEKIESEGKSIDDVINKIQNTANLAVGGWSIGKFVSQMMQVRGQFQQTEMAFKTMLQSESKANDLMQQMIRTAAITPFGVEDVTEGAKQLLAFNVAAEDVNDTIIRLGDVAAGMGINLSDLVMLYGTTIAKGKMDTMDLYQFLNRGIPIADELAKVMGLDVNNAIAEVKKQLTEGKVTSDIFIKAMQNMTSEGSKFGGLMEAQSHTITGQISNIEDAIEQMFNELGKSQEGIINTGLDVVSTLVENWQKVGEVVMVAATAYGTYKAVLMTVTALQTLNNRILQQAVVEKTLAAAAGINLSNAEAVEAARTKFLTLAQKSLTAAIRETTMATLANPYVLMAAAITSLVYAIYKFSTAASAAEIAQDAWNKSIDEFNKKADERKQKIKELVSTIQDASSTDLQKQLSFDELKNIAPELTKVYDSVEKLQSADLSQFNTQLNEMSDREREEGLKAQIRQLQEYAKALQNVSASAEAGNARRAAVQGLKDNYGMEASWSLDKSGKLNDSILEYIDKLEGELEKIQKAKDELSTPTEIEIKLAESEYKQSKESLDYLSNFALAMKNDIERNPTKIPFDGGEADRVISELEHKADELRKEQQDHPIQFTAEKQKALDKYQELLEDIKRWRNTAWMQGTFTIPVEIQFKMKKLEEETGKAKGRFNYLTGKYEKANKDESYAAAKKQAKVDYEAAVNAEKEAKKGSNKGWEEKKEDLDKKRKIYEKYWGPISAASNKANKAVSDAKKKIENQLKAQEEINEELKALQQKNTDETISLMQEGTEKKLAQIKNDYAKRKAEIAKQEAEFKKKNKEAGKKASLTSAQSDALTEARKLAKQNFDKQTAEVNKESLDAMRDYLKEYGSLYQQKQAIVEEYEEKISKAQTEGEKKTLQQQKKQALSNFDYESISMGIDWKGLMSGVGNMSKEMLKPMFDKLEAYTNTPQFQQADTQTQQKVVDLMQEIRTYLGTDQKATWQNLAESITSFNQSVTEYQKAVEEEKRQTENYKSAKTLHDKGSISDKEFQQVKKAADDASQAVVDAKTKMNTFGVKLNSATEAVVNYTSGLTAALNKLRTWKGNEGFSEVQSAVGNIDALKGALDESLSTMGKGAAKTMGETISKGLGNTLGSIGDGITNMMGSALGSIVGVVAQIPKLILNLASSIKSFVTGILDSFTELLKFEWLSDLVNSILASVGNLIDAIFDLPENLYNVLQSIVVNGVGGLINSVVGRVGNILSLGALSSKGPSSWFTNSNAEKVQKTIDRLTDRNERLQQSIEDLTDAMNDSYGSKATSYYKQAYENQQERNQNYLEIAKEQAGYHGSHKSWNKRWSGFSDEEMAWIKENVKSDFNGDLFSLSPEEMKLLRGNVAIWEHIENTGKGNYGGRLTEKLDDYIDQAGKLEELSDQLKENLTQISFDSMKDSFISSLMDMSKSAQDFSDDFAEMLQKALLTYSMEDLINGDLKKLYDDWAKAMEEKNGSLTDKDIEDFNKRYDEIVEEGIKRRDDWAKMTGYTGSSSSSQTATSGGWQSMGQDTANELNGRFTALQIAGENISANMITTVAQMETIVATGISTNGAVVEIRNMMIMTNSYLEDIVKYAKLTYNEFGAKIDDMNRRLKEI